MRKTEPLNHHMVGGCSELDWTILRSGHDLDHTNLSCMGCRVGTVEGRYCIAQGRTYQVEFGVPCLIGTSVPAVGCSRPQWVRWVVLRGWHGAWGNLKEKSQLEVGPPRLENFPVPPIPLLRRNLALVVRWDERIESVSMATRKSQSKSLPL